MNWTKIFNRGIAIGIIFFIMITVATNLFYNLITSFILFNFCFLVCTYYSKYEWGIIGFLTRDDKDGN